MRILLAINSLKGCLTSMEANMAAAEGIKGLVYGDFVKQVPVSDGGEGFLDAYRAAVGGEVVQLTVRDPMMRPVTAKYLMVDHTAVIETAQASGMSLLSTAERNPLKATSYGTGQLIADAVRRGATEVIAGLGGSATSDAGIGMLQALIDAFAPGGRWDDIESLSQVRFTIACDVSNPLYGDQGAARVFAPQKGATPAMVELLDQRARKFAEVSASHFGRDCSRLPGAGAAGGIGYSFLQYLHADYCSGSQFLLDAIHFRELAYGVNLIITGEGRADHQTLMGKLPMGVLSRRSIAPVALIAGSISDKDMFRRAGFAHVECINPPDLPLAEALNKDVARRNIAKTVAGIICELIDQ